MYDPYIQLRTHAYQNSLKHPQTHTTWQDATRENKDTDICVRLRCTFFESLMYSFTTDLRACLHQCQLNISNWRREWADALKIKRHTAIHR